MSRILLIATADVHLQEGAWRSRDIRSDARIGFRQAVDLSVAQRAPLVVAGDFFDSDTPDPGTVGFACEQFDRMERARVPLLHVQGNHDFHRSGPWPGVHTWPVHLPTAGLVDAARGWAGGEVFERHWLYGLDWTSAGRLAAAMAAIPPAVLANPEAIFVSHQAWAQHLRFEGAAEGDLADLPGSCVCLCGDFHGGDGDTMRALAVGDHLVLSPGSVALQDIAEDPDKSLWVLEEGDDGGRRWRRHYLRCRAVLKCRVADDVDLAALPDAIERWLADYEASGRKDDLPEELHRPIVAVWHPEGLAGVPAATQRFGDVVHLFLKPVGRRPQRPAAEAGLRPARAASLIDGLDFVVPREDPRRADLERLLTSADPAAELSALKAEFFERKGEGDGEG